MNNWNPGNLWNKISSIPSAIAGAFKTGAQAVTNLGQTSFANTQAQQAAQTAQRLQAQLTARTSGAAAPLTSAAINYSNIPPARSPSIASAPTNLTPVSSQAPAQNNFTGAYGANFYTPPQQDTPPTPISVGPMTPQVNSGSLTGTPVTYNDILSKIGSNLDTYNQSAQQSQGELDAQGQLIAAMKAQQGQAVDRYGAYTNPYGAPQDVADAEYNSLPNQLAALRGQNAVGLAQQGLQFQQQNRGVRAQVAQTGLSTAMQEAQLYQSGLKEVQPGSSLYNTNSGNVAFQGSGMAPAQYSQTVSSWYSAFLNQGYPADQAMQLAQQQASSFSGGQQGQAGGPQGQPSAPAPLLQGNSVLGYNLSTYATDPQYAQKVANATSSLPTNLTFGPQGISQYIQSVAPNSPINGQMVYNAAAQYGVDPRVMLGMLNVESKFGTEGAAAKTNNPGNVGNVDSGATHTFANVQDGLNAMASEIAKRHSSQQVGTSQDNTDAVGQLKALFPQNIQNGVVQTAQGIPYLNLSQIPQAQQGTAQTLAAKYGIKALSGDDAKGLQALDTISQALNQMTVLVQKNLMPANGGLGTAGNVIKNWWGSITGTNSSLADFGLNKDLAAKAVTALAGGAGSGLRLNAPVLDAAINNLPTQNDSLETAMEKINKTRDLLAVQLGTAFNNPGISNGVLKYEGHSYMPGDLVANSNGQIGVVNADGTITPQQQ